LPTDEGFRCSFLNIFGIHGRIAIKRLVPIKRIDYYDTEHYRVMHDFVVNPRRMLDILFSADDSE